jgi:hypothetical protein
LDYRKLAVGLRRVPQKGLSAHLTSGIKFVRREYTSASVKQHLPQELHAHIASIVILGVTRWCLILVAALTDTLAQSPNSGRAFDVVSIKPSAPDEHNSFMAQRLPGGSLRLIGAPLRMMIMRAYDVKAFQLSGGPDWVRSDRWDVLAKAEGVEDRLTLAQERPMLQALLGVRFQLKVHTETKELPVYALTLDKNGSKLIPSAGTQPQFRNGNGTLIAKKVGIAALVTWPHRN